MSFPAGLEWSDRIAPVGDGRYAFQCQRQGHSRVRVVRPTRDAAQALRARHDAIYHSELLAELGIRLRHQATVGEVVAAYLEHIGRLEAAGSRNSKTTRYYEQCAKLLLEGFGPDLPAVDISRSDIDEYISWRRKNGTTRGDRIAKELKALQTMLRRAEVPFAWRVRDDDIRAKRSEKVHLTPAIIAAFIQDMPEGSVERAFCILKLRTALRNVEIADLRVSNVDPSNQLLRFKLKAKSREYAHVFPLTDDVMEALRPHLKGKKPNEYLLQIEGRRLVDSSLRWRFRAASKRAGIEPPIQFVAQFRAEAITAASHAVGVARVSRAIGHRSVKTTERFYLLDADQLEEKREIAAAMAAELPVKVPRGTQDRKPPEATKKPPTRANSLSQRKR